MFQREIELALSCGERMVQGLQTTLETPGMTEAMPRIDAAMEAAWRTESAMGEFLAIGEHKLRATGLVQTAETLWRAFDVLRPALADADRARRLPEAQMKDWIKAFQPQARQVVETIREAKEQMPAVGSHRISAPVGQAPPGQGKATVSIARTSARSLDVADVEALVRRALAPLGGIERFVQPGQTVLLKPNQTLFVLAIEGSTTDPRLVAALTRLCYGAGASKVIVGESSGGASNSMQVMTITGVKLLAEREGAAVIDFHRAAQREVDIPRGKVLKHALLPVPLLEADVVINLPKLKTHNWDWISGALKNWVGIVDPTWRSAHHNAHTYDEYLDLHCAVPAQLTVMDALIRGEGNGPGANFGCFYGAVMAGTDPTAVDVVAAQIQGFDPAAIGFIQAAGERGFGVSDPRQISVVGVPLQQAVAPAVPPVEGVDMYQANIIVGTGLTRAGTLGHFKSLGDVFQMMGVWSLVERLHGRVTILIGNAEDPLFTAHLRQGPYVVIDDAAPDRYKHHPKVHVIPGHPVLHNLIPLLLPDLGIAWIGELSTTAMRDIRQVESHLQFNAPRALAPLVPAAFHAYRRLSPPLQIGLGLVATGIVKAGGAGGKA